MPGHATPAEAVAACPPPRGRRVRIAIPDGTRPVDVPAALAALQPYVGEAVAVVGLGLHRPMAAAELPASPFPLVQHDPDDTVATRTVDGVPGGVSRALAGADVVLGVGVVELHQYAGFSGGHKAVSVGLGARATIDALHHRDRVTAPGVVLGNLDGNPFRAVVDALGEAAGLGWVLDVAGCRWFAGEPRAVLREAAASLDCWLDVPTAVDAAVLLVPPRKAVNFYQASRAATYLALSARPPLREGATIFLDAACPEGMGEGSGERAFAELAARVPYPWASVLTGPPPTGGGTQRLVMLAQLLTRYRLVVGGCADPAPLRACGLDAHREPAARLAPPGALVVADPFGRLPRLG
jgi:nickel-dependent lactate racemase